MNLIYLRDCISQFYFQFIPQSNWICCWIASHQIKLFKSSNISNSTSVTYFLEAWISNVLLSSKTIIGISHRTNTMHWYDNYGNHCIFLKIIFKITFYGNKPDLVTHNYTIHLSKRTYKQQFNYRNKRHPYWFWFK